MLLRKILIITLLISSVIVVNAQSITLGISAGANNYFDPKIMKGDLNRYYYGLVGGKALTVEAGYEGFLKKYKALRVSLLIDHYSGKLLTNNTLGIRDFKNYEMNCTRVGIGISPYRFELMRNLILSPAFEVNVLAINGGTLYTSHRPDSLMVSVITEVVESKIPREIYNTFNAAASLSLSYRIPLAGKYYIAPNYRYYYGLMYEFRDDQQCVVTRRNQFGIIFGMK